jgi:NADH-quinone oxidoreductase subunit M
VAFFAIALAFLVKTPIWPLHTWLPEAYVEAPAPVTMILTGALSKLGVYGLLRIALPLFPTQAHDFSGVLTTFAVITIVAGALAALAQSDLKKTMAYSSMSHVGYCALGAFAAAASTGDAAARTTALDGVVVQMFNHGVSAAALFYFVHLLEQKTRLRGIDDFGGLRTTAPLFAWCIAFALFGSLGLPGLSGFVGELLIFKGALSLYPILTGVALVGLIVTAVYCLRIIQRVCWQGVSGRSAEVTELHGSERFVSFVLIAFILAAGLWPAPWVNAANATVMALVGGAK